MWNVGPSCIIARARFHRSAITLYPGALKRALHPAAHQSVRCARLDGGLRHAVNKGFWRSCGRCPGALIPDTDNQAAALTAAILILDSIRLSLPLTAASYGHRFTWGLLRSDFATELVTRELATTRTLLLRRLACKETYFIGLPSPAGPINSVAPLSVLEPCRQKPRPIFYREEPIRFRSNPTFKFMQPRAVLAQ
jgi:hypothetical protein